MRKDAKDFANWLDMTMENMGTSNRDLASMVGVHDSVVSRWRSGRTKPTMENLDKIASALDVDVVRLAATAGYMDSHHIDPLPVPVPTAARRRIQRQLEQIHGLVDEDIEAVLISWDQRNAGGES